jgi:hypothetical protein
VRLRYGFASYLVPGYWIDHVIVEVWNGTDWQRFDAQLGNELRFMNLAATEFISGGQAWQMCRNEGADPTHFGLGPMIPDVRGWWFIRGRLLLDFASLNKQELLCWDEWDQAALSDSEDDTLLDKAAALSQESDSTAFHALYASDARLRVPQTILCYSPAVGPHEVKVSLSS